MKMPNNVAQMRIVRDLTAAESALDEALLKQSSLLSTMVVARRDTNNGPFVGQEALLRLTKAHQTLVSAGAELARVHGTLQKVQNDVLGYEPCPENEPMGLTEGIGQAA